MAYNSNAGIDLEGKKLSKSLRDRIIPMEVELLVAKASVCGDRGRLGITIDLSLAGYGLEFHIFRKYRSWRFFPLFHPLVINFDSSPKK